MTLGAKNIIPKSVNVLIIVEIKTTGFLPTKSPILTKKIEPKKKPPSKSVPNNPI